MAEGQGKHQEKADMLLPTQSLVHLSPYSLFNLFCQVQSNLLLTRHTGRERVIVAKRQRWRRNPSQVVSSNLVLRDKYFYLFKKKTKTTQTNKQKRSEWEFEPLNSCSSHNRKAAVYGQSVNTFVTQARLRQGAKKNAMSKPLWDFGKGMWKPSHMHHTVQNLAQVSGYSRVWVLPVITGWGT